MTLQWTNPITNQVNEVQHAIEDALYGFIDKVYHETGYRRGHVEQPAYVQPDLIANIEAEARGEDPPDEYENAAAANYAKLGLMPYGGDPAADNMQRIADAPWMFPNPDAPTLLSEQPAYVAPTLTDLIVNEEAERRRGNRAAAPTPPAPGGQPAYVPPEMQW